MNWDTISGHAEVVRVLRNLVAANRIPHAMLFTGPAGVGKMMTARILAAALLCQGKGEVLPCGHCQACKKVLDQSHPDLMVVAGEKGSIKIDQVRTLQQQAAMVPYYGGRRIFILEDIETMTAQAANSLLKILEEPPESATFIMTTVSTHALLPTVLSRCRVFSFRALGFEVLTDYLVKRGIDLIAAKAAARLAGGSIGNALALTASPGGLSLRDQAVTLITQVPDGDLSLVWQTAGEMDKRETGELGHLFHYMSIIFRDLVMIRMGQRELVFNLDITAQLEEMVNYWSEAGLRQAWKDVNEAGRALLANANPRLTYEALMIKCFDAVRE